MALFTVSDLTFYYPEAETPALSHVSFSVEPGEFLVICGKSGCGKSTLLQHFKTALTPFGKRTGEIRFLGQPLEEVTARMQAGKIGYVMQSPDNQIVTDKVWHELAFGMENLGYDQQTIRLRVAEMASYFGIQNWFSKGVDELSGGQKQILNLASIMAMQPAALVLDEPTSQLDPIAASEFLRTIKKINSELGTTVIMIEHRLEEVFPMADRVLTLEDSKVLCWDTPKNTGKKLAGRDMFLAMPAPIQIYDGCNNQGECPLTVREGRDWLEEICPQPEITDIKAVLPEEFIEAEEKEVVIKAKDVWFRYERNLPDVVKDLSMEVHKGELFCMLGGNGTGKSTTLSLLSRINRPYRGKIWLKGKEIQKYSDKELFDHFLGVLPQNPQCLFVADTVEKDLREMFQGRKLSKEEQDARIDQVVKDTEIRHLLAMHPYDLSGGEQQRAALAKVLLLEPEIILLDEPTKGLDGFYKEKLAKIFARLQKKGVTMLMVSHDIEFCASYGDTCAMFFDGSIVTAQKARDFFCGNSFYTTVANRMARQVFPDAITVKDVIALWQANQK